MLLVRSDATLEALLGNDWVAVHELSHLALPLLRRRAAWISEGVATYYQEVLRVRQGLQSEADAWRHVLEGFERGRRVGTDRTLAEESADMMETRSFRRVYWSGTAFALELDTALRQETGGRHSLDTAVADLNETPFDVASLWTAERFCRRVDRATGTTVASELGRRYARLRTFPDVRLLLERLGVSKASNGQVSLSRSAPLASVRERIMREEQAAARSSARGRRRARVGLGERRSESEPRPASRR
jgi:predicted metalloprotease with PDZ domain